MRWKHPPEHQLEMREAAESEERREEELHVAKEEVEKCLSVEQSAVEYQPELWRRPYYKYYNDEGDADDEGDAEDEDHAVVEFSLGDTESTNGRILPGQIVNISSYTSEHMAARRQLSAPWEPGYHELSACGPGSHA